MANFKIGSNTYDSKAAALVFYKEILSRYEVGFELKEEDFNHVMALCKMGWTDEEGAKGIENIVVDFHPHYKSTKCFQIIIDGDAYQFSYRLRISGSSSNATIFSQVCRHEVKEQIRQYKKTKFLNRPVQCAKTGEIVEWEECHVDHKSPLTFSVIVKGFVVANGIDVDSIEYETVDWCSTFSDRELAEKFCHYHKSMAVLRILSIKSNNKLASSARVKPSKNDTALNTIKAKS
jgi:hypothetical protein